MLTSHGTESQFLGCQKKSKKGMKRETAGWDHPSSPKRGYFDTSLTRPFNVDEVSRDKMKKKKMKKKVKIYQLSSMGRAEGQEFRYIILAFLAPRSALFVVLDELGKATSPSCRMEHCGRLELTAVNTLATNGR